VKSAIVLLVAASQAIADPLPSWNDGPTKDRIIEFVHEVTNRASPWFVPAEDRIATFDQDGTLWVEHPLYAQAQFALARLRELAPKHPEWKTEEPFRTVLTGDENALGVLSEADWMRIVVATHAGMSTEELEPIVRAWLKTARHPRFDRPYTELVYEPMLELMSYLRDNGFQTYIVTGGGEEFVRVYADAVYGLPPSRVIGSTISTKYEMTGGAPVLMREPKISFIDDGAGKPVAIDLVIGKRPLLAFGNSDGDREMLEWTTVGQKGAHLGGLVLHTDRTREYEYGPAKGLPDTKVGRFSQELYDEAQANGWLVVDMKRDWKRIFK
jgi:phosphoserine phosphatase